MSGLATIEKYSPSWRNGEKITRIFVDGANRCPAMSTEALTTAARSSGWVDSADGPGGILFMLDTMPPRIST